MRTFGRGLVLAAVVGSAVGVAAQSLQPGNPATLLKDPAVLRAIDGARESERRALEDQVRFCETAAPPFQERARGEVLRREFAELGLRNVRIDGAGNVIGVRPGAGTRPHVVVASHLDTVFPPETPVRVTRSGTSLRGPGIGDNCRGLAVLVAMIRTLRDAGVKTPGTITFVANVGEEGVGDLRGVKEFFGVAGGGRPRTDVDAFVSIDGPGLFVMNKAVGSRRYKVTFKGPGGHSYASFGTPSPVGALGRAVARISEIRATNQAVTFNVGRIGGGTSVNAIPADAWMEIDLRSIDPASLASLDERIAGIIDAAVVEENVRWNRPGAVTVVREVLGIRPGASLPEGSAIVATALAVGRALRLTVPLSEASTDANLPMSLGIPAVTIGGGGTGTDAHALTESFDSTDSWKGTQNALLLTIALAQK